MSRGVRRRPQGPPSHLRGRASCPRRRVHVPHRACLLSPRWYPQSGKRTPAEFDIGRYLKAGSGAWKSYAGPFEQVEAATVEARIDLGKSLQLLGFTQLPRQGGNANGRIRGYEFYVSADGQQWEPVVKDGRLPNNDQLQEVRFEKPATGRYIRLVALSEWFRQPYTTIAEFDVLAAK